MELILCRVEFRARWEEKDNAEAQGTLRSAEIGFTRRIEINVGEVQKDNPDLWQA
jgi:hypothetical protein